MDNQPGLFDYQNYDHKIHTIPIAECEAHPLNPRISADEEALSRLVSAIQSNGFLAEHAIMVRHLDGKYQIVSGHRRWVAAKKAEAVNIPAWVYEDMSDEEAHSLLLLDNEQSELSPLEKGKHAYDHIQLVGKGKGGAGQTGGIREYAREHGYVSPASITEWYKAYEVYKSVRYPNSLSHTILYEISKSPEEAWAALCKYATEEKWTVKQTQDTVKKISNIEPDEDYGYDMAKIYSFAARDKGKDSRKYQDLFKSIVKAKDTFKENAITLYNMEETDQAKEENHQRYVLHKAIPFEYHPREELTKKIKEHRPIEAPAIEIYAREIRQFIAIHSESGDQWIAKREPEEVEALRRIAEEERWASFLFTRVICGQMEDRMGHISEASINMILTDPPYGLGQTAYIEFDTVGHERKPIAAPKGDWDHSTEYDLWIGHFRRVLKPTGSLYIFVPDYQISHLWDKLVDAGFNVRNLITWHKTNPTPSVRKRQFCHACEYILFATISDEYTFNWQEQNEMHNEISLPVCQGKERTEHPTQKPLALLEKFIEISTEPGDLILDPFAGVGSTGVAAHKLNRDFMLIEKESKWCQETKSRLWNIQQGKAA